MLHSSLRNVIERCFGILKKRWNILNLMAPYPYPTQVKIVVASMVIHNFIIEQRYGDEILEAFEDENCYVNNSHTSNGDCENMEETPNTPDDTEMRIVRNRIRDQIVSSRERH